MYMCEENILVDEHRNVSTVTTVTATTALAVTTATASFPISVAPQFSSDECNYFRDVRYGYRPPRIKGYPPPLRNSSRRSLSYLLNRNFIFRQHFGRDSYIHPAGPAICRSSMRFSSRRGPLTCRPTITGATDGTADIVQRHCWCR